MARDCKSHFYLPGDRTNREANCAQGGCEESSVDVNLTEKDIPRAAENELTEVGGHRN
jgi:hypothetical protein